MYAARSKSLMVKNPCGFSSVRIWACMAVPNVSRHMCHSPEGLWQTPTVPVKETSVAPIHVGGCGLISRRCVDLAANNAAKWRHTWGKKVEVSDVCRQIQVVDGLKPLGVLIGENFGFYGSAEC